MEEKRSFFDNLNDWSKNSLTLKLLTMGILISILLIPVTMITDLIAERHLRQREAVAEVNSKWGHDQTVKGLVLSIPYYHYERIYNEDDEKKYRLIPSINYAHFLPNSLLIKGVVKPKILHRGIFEVAVYETSLSISGSFPMPDLSQWNIDDKDILWDKATISLGLSDLRGIQEEVALQWNQKSFAFSPGLPSNDVIDQGISTRIPLEMKNTNTFQFKTNIRFNGSSSLNFVPLGKTTEVELTSPWTSPSFIGSFLPDDRTIDKEGFSARWNVLHLNRSYPQSFLGPQHTIKTSDEEYYEIQHATSYSDFGVHLFIPADEYQKSTRAAKYAVLFIALTFIIFFFIQILQQVRIHPFQYIVVGLALCVFYTLLISLSERLDFSLSYLISSGATIILITAFMRGISKETKVLGITGSILTLIYLFIYVIIQMEDPLLMGSIGLFVILAIIMYLSNKIDWYDIRNMKRK